MSVITCDVPSVNPDADDTDLDLSGFIPDDDDARWAAETFGADTADYDVEPDVDELAAAESAFLDAHEAGLFSFGLGDFISRASLVGHPA